MLDDGRSEKRSRLCEGERLRAQSRILPLAGEEARSPGAVARATRSGRRGRRKVRRAVRVHGHVGVSLATRRRKPGSVPQGVGGEAGPLPARAARLAFPQPRPPPPRILSPISPPRGCPGDSPANRAFASMSHPLSTDQLYQHYLLFGDVPCTLHQIAGSMVVACHAQAPGRPTRQIRHSSGYRGRDPA